jgi:hypothetical protein
MSELGNCVICDREKPINKNSVCDECIQDEKDREREDHLKDCSRMPIEKRLQRLEGLLYDNGLKED